jgi:hypothetical protein
MRNINKNDLLLKAKIFNLASGNRKYGHINFNKFALSISLITGANGEFFRNQNSA